MKRSWTALAVALMAIFAVGGCNDYGNTFQNNTGALVSFLAPAQISAGNGDFTLTWFLFLHLPRSAPAMGTLL